MPSPPDRSPSQSKIAIARVPYALFSNDYLLSQPGGDNSEGNRLWIWMQRENYDWLMDPYLAQSPDHPDWYEMTSLGGGLDPEDPVGGPSWIGSKIRPWQTENGRDLVILEVATPNGLMRPSARSLPTCVPIDWVSVSQNDTVPTGKTQSISVSFGSVRAPALDSKEVFLPHLDMHWGPEKLPGRVLKLDAQTGEADLSWFYSRSRQSISNQSVSADQLSFDLGMQKSDIALTKQPPLTHRRLLEAQQSNEAVDPIPARWLEHAANLKIARDLQGAANAAVTPDAAETSGATLRRPRL
ncbi:MULTISPECIES: hypothetical protein [unclassified Thioalkalivibrio]|uniref:hypothetical protein n=1 Tax=unclassified Thioalkalivibrio TaxID=2621013 RepID=UPI00035FA322|nr:MULTISPECIES: hypothetical protein [unclassified Thioalkalivibrio]